MPRTKKAAHGQVTIVGSLCSRAGESDLLLEGKLDNERPVYLGFQSSEWANSQFGPQVAQARRMRALAETLLKAAQRLEKRAALEKPHTHEEWRHYSDGDSIAEVPCSGGSSCPDFWRV